LVQQYRGQQLRKSNGVGDVRGAVGKDASPGESRRRVTATPVVLTHTTRQTPPLSNVYFSVVSDRRKPAAGDLCEAERETVSQDG